MEQNSSAMPSSSHVIDSERQGVLSTIMAGNPSAALEDSISTPVDDLKSLTERTGMPVFQQNGQRHIGPPRDYDGPEPPKGSEVFIGKLPRDVFEPEIYRLFETVGRIYEIRMMMDFSGTNRGYCFVKYFTPEDASRAVDELNNKEIKKGRYIGVLLSVDNCRLFVGKIPRDKTEAEILEEMKKVTDDVRRVICYPSAEDKTKNRGFAFVEYESHRAAAMARRKLLPKKIQIWGEWLQVDWAEPLPEVKASIMEKVTVLYVRNLSLATSEEQLMKVFNEFSDNGVEKVKKMTDYAFIHFFTRDQADAAKNSLDRTEIDGCLIDIEWSKPADKDTHKPKKAMSHGGHRNNYQRSGQSGFSRRPIFNGFHQGFGPSPPTRYSAMTGPTQAHENAPLTPGLSCFDYDQIEALSYAFGNQRFFPPRVMQPRENSRARGAGGVQNFHVPSEAAMQQQARRAYHFPGSAIGGFVPEQYLHGIQAGYYPYPVFPQEIQQFSQEIAHNGY